MESKDWRQIRRVLAVRLDNVGDVVMLGPALRTLKGAMPDSEVTLLSSPAGSQTIPLLPWVDDLLVHRAVWQDVSGDGSIDVGAQVDLIELIESRRFDAALIFTSFSQSPYPPAYVCYLAGVKTRIGQSKEFGGGLLTHRVRPLPDPTHQVDRNLYLLEASGLPVAGRQLELRVPQAARTTAVNLLHRLRIPESEPFLVLAPGASAVSRRYPVERFAKVCALLADRIGLPVVLVGDPKEVPLADRIIEAAPDALVTSAVGQTSIPEMAAIVERSELVICNNAAPMHVADALRRPLVVLYAGTDLESQWQPRGSVASLLRQATRCAPCYGLTCDYGLACLDIPPTVVVEEAVNVLEKAGQREAGRGAEMLALPPAESRPAAGELS